MNDLFPDLQGVVGSRVSDQDSFHQTLDDCGLWKTLRRFWPNHRPVRFVYFDKSSEQNWALPWHQDRVIALQDRLDVPGFRNWTQKAGVWHCEPPVNLLARMLFLRFHIDASTVENGGMEIALGSHGAGLIRAGDAASIAESCVTEVSHADPGDLLVLKMLTLHRSRPSMVPKPRRVLRIDMADFDLPGGLNWAAT